MGYISKAGRENLKKYRYHGVDKSLLYKYALSDWAQWCVDKFIPLNMAPNTITLIGLVLQVIACAALFAYCPTMKEDAPRWACALAGLCLFAYSTLDNMDGKQARRVGASSPLGLLFDHGCDAINCSMIGTLTFSMAVRADAGTWQPYALWTLACLPFFANTWEEFHLRNFVLPVINGPNEGLMASIAFLFISAIFGSSVWQRPHPLGFVGAWTIDPLILTIRSWVGDDVTAPVTNLDALLAGMGSLSVATQLYMLGNVFGTILSGSVQAVAPEVQSEEKLRGRRSAAFAALLRQASFWFLQGSCMLWLNAPFSRLVAAVHPFLWFFAAGCLFCDSVCKLMVSHVCEMRYRPFWGGQLLFLLGPLSEMAINKGFTAHLPGWLLEQIPSGILHPSFASAHAWLLLSFLLALGNLIYFGQGAIKTITETLDIAVFDISKQVARHQQQQQAARLQQEARALAEAEAREREAEEAQTAAAATATIVAPVAVAEEPVAPEAPVSSKKAAAAPASSSPVSAAPVAAKGRGRKLKKEVEVEEKESSSEESEEEQEAPAPAKKGRAAGKKAVAQEAAAVPAAANSRSRSKSAAGAKQRRRAL